ncbi:MAG TPA: hypothetical protein VE684_05255, partial [Crenalkalicoccus sp.]|nr:hypothetical protein [Crenalkalicoccus sp.]
MKNDPTYPESPRSNSAKPAGSQQGCRAGPDQGDTPAHASNGTPSADAAAPCGHDAPGLEQAAAAWPTLAGLRRWVAWRTERRGKGITKVPKNPNTRGNAGSTRPQDWATRDVREEWPGILRWMINGCLEYQRTGLKPPPAVVEATRAYFDAQDHFGQWLK